MNSLSVLVRATNVTLADKPCVQTTLIAQNL